MADIDSGTCLERDFGIRRQENERGSIWRKVKRRETVKRYLCFRGSVVFAFVAFRFLGWFWFLQ